MTYSLDSRTASGDPQGLRTAPSKVRPVSPRSLDANGNGWRLLFLYLDRELPSTRVRTLQMAPYLESGGFRTECARFPRSLAERVALWRRRAAFDLVVVQDRLFTHADTLFLKAFGRPVVLDFDDALPFRHKPKRGSFRSATRTRRFQRTLRRVIAATVGNSYLADLAGGLGKPVHVAPSPVPFPVQRRIRRADDWFRVGWIGTGGNIHNLRQVEPALRELAKRVRLRLVVISDTSISMKGVDVEHRRWSLETQADDIAHLDAGIMPLEDNPWNRGKCAYKVLQYMAAGVPSVASPVGMNGRLIVDGKNGFLAEGDDWLTKLLRLHDDPALSRRISLAALKTVEVDYTYPVVARGMVEFLAKLLDGDRCAGLKHSGTV